MAEKLHGIAAIFDKIANLSCLVEIKDNEVVSGAVRSKSAGGCCTGFLMHRLSMDDGCHLLDGILPDAFPDAHDIAACCVHDLAAAFPDELNGFDLSAKRRNYHHVGCCQLVNFFSGGPGGEVTDSQRCHLGIDIRIVDDFAEEKNPAVGKNLARGIGQIDGPLDSIAEPELLRETDRCGSRLENTAVGADIFHQFAPVVAFDLGLHMGHHVRRAQVQLGGDDFSGLHRYPAAVHAAAGILRAEPVILRSTAGLPDR